MSGLQMHSNRPVPRGQRTTLVNKNGQTSTVYGGPNVEEIELNSSTQSPSCPSIPRSTSAWRPSADSDRRFTVHNPDHAMYRSVKQFLGTIRANAKSFEWCDAVERQFQIPTLLRVIKPGNFGGDLRSALNLASLRASRNDIFLKTPLSNLVLIYSTGDRARLIPFERSRPGGVKHAIDTILGHPFPGESGVGSKNYFAVFFLTESSGPMVIHRNGSICHTLTEKGGGHR